MFINYPSSSEANKKKNLQLKNGEKVTEIQCYSAVNYICIATRKFAEYRINKFTMMPQINCLACLASLG